MHLVGSEGCFHVSGCALVKYSQVLLCLLFFQSTPQAYLNAVLRVSQGGNCGSHKNRWTGRDAHSRVGSSETGHRAVDARGPGGAHCGTGGRAAAHR